MAGAAGGIDAPLELGEDARVAGAGLSEGRVFFGAAVELLFILPELGFGGAESAEGPLAVDELIDEKAGFGGSGEVALVILVDELLEAGAVFVREGERSAVDAGFEAVHEGDGLARDRDGARGFLGVAAIGVNLAESRHGGSGAGRRTQRATQRVPPAPALL